MESFLLFLDDFINNLMIKVSFCRITPWVRSKSIANYRKVTLQQMETAFLISYDNLENSPKDLTDVYLCLLDIDK